MRTAVVMVTMADRVLMLNHFMESLVQHQPGREIIIHVQGDQGLWENNVVIPDGLDVGHLMFSPQGVGCHAARVELLRQAPRYDAYVNVDDDVELIEQTNWQAAIDYTADESVGFVLTNWVKHPNALPAAIERMEDKFYPQTMVYQGGGMAYREPVAELMRALPNVHARYDDLWPLTTYLNGYRNWRYQGSLAVHRIMTRGGMHGYMKAEPRPLLAWEWVEYPRLKTGKVGNEFGIPLDNHLKPAAIQRHHEARAERGWEAHRGRA